MPSHAVHAVAHGRNRFLDACFTHVEVPGPGTQGIVVLNVNTLATVRYGFFLIIKHGITPKNLMLDQR